MRGRLSATPSRPRSRALLAAGAIFAAGALALAVAATRSSEGAPGIERGGQLYAAYCLS